VSLKVSSALLSAMTDALRRPGRRARRTRTPTGRRERPPGFRVGFGGREQITPAIPSHSCEWRGTSLVTAHPSGLTAKPPHQLCMCRKVATDSCPIARVLTPKPAHQGAWKLHLDRSEANLGLRGRPGRKSIGRRPRLVGPTHGHNGATTARMR